MMIELFTKNNCMQCNMTKKLLANQGTHFRVVNIDEDLKALEHLIELGIKQVPVTFKDDELVCIGFSPDKLRKL